MSNQHKGQVPMRGRFQIALFALPILLLILLIGLPISPLIASDALPSQPADEPVQQPLSGPAVPGQLLVRWQPGTEPDVAREMLSRLGVEEARPLACVSASLVQVPAGQEAIWQRRLLTSPDVAYAGPNYLARAATAPNDPYWIRQWNVRRVAAHRIWDLTTGQPGVLVALLDSGVDLDHPDLENQLVGGYDYINRDGMPDDDNGHGTHVAGIIVAQGNNGLGVAGIAWNVRLMPLKVLNQYNEGPYDVIIEALCDAADSGAHVINLSFAGPDDPSLHEAVTYAYDAGAVLVAAAGNFGSQVSYPAAYPEVIAVAATTHDDEHALYSNTGSEVDVAAPGGSQDDPIWSTVPGGYGYKYGTSMAAPHVASLAALLKSVDSRLTNAQIANQIRFTADQMGQHPYSTGRNDYLGYGRINVERAVRAALSPTLQVTPDRAYLLADQKGLLRPTTIHLINPSLQPLSWQVHEVGSSDWLVFQPPVAGQVSYEKPGQATVSARLQGLNHGYYTTTIEFTSIPTGAVGAPFQMPVILSYVQALRTNYFPLTPAGYQTASWLDATTGGARVIVFDDEAAPVALPFVFPFYERQYSIAWIADNGLISFEQPYTGQTSARNQCLPNSSAPDDAIYVLWDDLNPDAPAAGIYIRSMDANTFVIEWYQVATWSDGSRHTFE
ncbi:MAG TPA: hypothetical protein EYP04_02145, partial [Anaerolineae bacterium]|nr:hypothetical protein [Anaerolineae bacterium]